MPVYPGALRLADNPLLILTSGANHDLHQPPAAFPSEVNSHEADLAHRELAHLDILLEGRYRHLECLLKNNTSESSFFKGP